jgi:hypothetical protein
MGIIGSFVMWTLPPLGGNINGKLSEEEATVPVPKWCGFRTVRDILNGFAYNQSG